MPQIRYVRLGRGPVNPLMQIIGVIVGLVVLAVAVVVGGFVLAAMIGFALIAWLVFYARAWWLMRGVNRDGEQPGAGSRGGEEIVDAEYRVIETTRSDDDA